MHKVFRSEPYERGPAAAAFALQNMLDQLPGVMIHSWQEVKISATKCEIVLVAIKLPTSVPIKNGDAVPLSGGN